MTDAQREQIVHLLKQKSEFVNTTDVFVYIREYMEGNDPPTEQDANDMIEELEQLH